MKYNRHGHHSEGLASLSTGKTSGLKHCEIHFKTDFTVLVHAGNLKKITKFYCSIKVVDCSAPLAYFDLNIDAFAE